MLIGPRLTVTVHWSNRALFMSYDGFDDGVRSVAESRCARQQSDSLNGMHGNTALEAVGCWTGPPSGSTISLPWSDAQFTVPNS
jgi:hypothetical protein